MAGTIYRDQQVGGWAGRTHRLHPVASPIDVPGLQRALAQARLMEKSVIAMGAGCSYADQIQNEAGVVIDCRGLCGVDAWDPATGRLSVRAGTTLADILRLALPAGWTLPGVPGSFMVTVGGAIANNVHGKDAHRFSFGGAVRAFDLLDADGRVATVTRDSDGALFRGVLGGMGLLGIVVAADLQLERIPSAWVEVETIRTFSLAESLRVFGGRNTRDFALGWMNSLAGGARQGAGVISFARWTERAEAVPPGRIDTALTVNERMFGLVPGALVWRAGAPMLRAPGLRLTNAVYHLAAMRKGRAVVPFPDFYFLYNRINGLDEAYRPHGFAEIQALLPRGAELDVCRDLLAILGEERQAPIFTTMKGHVADDCLLGFPGDGMSVTFGLRKPGGDRSRFRDALSRLFERVIAAGGRVNPSKDEFLSSAQFRRMYGGADAFLDLKRRVDPAGRFQSDQYRRLFGVTAS